MKVTAVAAPDGASDPKHPDHDRWVKDRTLKMEIDHAKAVGIPLRAAEEHNARMLERSARIARDAKPTAKKTEPAEARRARHRERGVISRPVAPEVKALKISPCGRCGKCLPCKRERRAMLIIQRRKENRSLDMLALRMFVAALHSKAGSGKFKGLSKRDTDRAMSAEVEAVCDASVRWLGAWR